MQHTTGYPCRVYDPASGRFATATARDSVGLVLEFDDEKGKVHYGPPAAYVEVTEEDAEKGHATLIDGRVVLFGSTTLPGTEE